jgi:hypothetical protein
MESATYAQFRQAHARSGRHRDAIVPSGILADAKCVMPVHDHTMCCANHAGPLSSWTIDLAAIPDYAVSARN